MRDQYLLVRELGRGGMATVYLAQDRKHDRPVALKFLHPDLATAVGAERFLREIRLTAHLQHPHILPVLDSGATKELLWYSMPYVEGESLRQRLSREGELPLDEALEITRQLAAALAYAHGRGVVHRDIKPENILLAGDQAVLADFGVARALSAAGDERGLTETGLAVGTPAYMSPEQASGGRLDARSDIYALACVLYEMLAAHPPFLGATAQEVMARHVTDTVPPLRTVRPAVPAAVEEAMERALAKGPADRFATATEFARALSALPSVTAPDPGAAGEQSPLLAPAANRRRRSQQRVVGLGMVLVLGVGAAALLWRSRAAPTVLDADLLAVAPFDVLDPKLPLWREGLVDLLARDLDGAGPLRTVSPTVVIRRWSGRADRTSATALGQRTGAGLALYGTLVGSGQDSVHLSASVLDVGRSQVVGEAELRGSADHMDQLADSLTVRVLRELGQARPIGAARSSGLGSRSVAALKAFLRGEQFFRRAEWDSAQASYERALALDSTFALAYWRLGTVYGSQDPQPPMQVVVTNDSLSRVYRLRAGVLNHGLSPRESLLVTGDSLWATLRQERTWMSENAIPDSTARERVRRLFATAEQVTRRYPTDPEGWFALGQVREAFGPGLGVSDQMKLAAFDRAIALDSSYAPAYFSPVELALNLDDLPAARRYVARYLALHAGGESAREMRVVGQLLDPGMPPPELERLLDTIPAATLLDVSMNFVQAPDSAEMALKLARRLATRPLPEDVWFSPTLQARLAGRLAQRGHFREAARIVSAQKEPTAEWRMWLFTAFTGLALAGVIPADTADAAFRRQLERDSLRSPLGERYAPPWWAARGDTAALKRYVELERRHRWALSRPPPPDTTGSPDYLRTSPYWLAAAEAYLALARRDTAAALTRFAALPNSTGPVWFERLTLARVLAARGWAREALAVLDREFPVAVFSSESRGIWALERARLAERIGEREKASYWYGYVAKLWRHADPELQPYVTEARAALGRLTAEPRR